MSSFIANSTARLNSALASAHAGDTIKLAPGTYSGVLINGESFSSAVTITSQDPTHAAVITDLNMAYDHGLVFSNLEFSFPLGDGTGTPHGIFVNHSQDIHFRSDSIHGILGQAPTYDQTGIGIAHSSNVSLEDSELQYLYTGLTMGMDSDILVSGNNFHDIRLDGIEGDADQNATITNNNFSNFHHIGLVGSGGDHSDAIQFWTTGQTVGSANLTVSNNVIVQGQGRDMQGIFIQDSVGNLPYQNVRVTSNLIVGGNWNGIMVDDGHGALVSNNTVAPTSSETQIPWIRVSNSNQAFVSHNSAGSFQLASNDANLTAVSDKINAPVLDQGIGAITVWLAGHPTHVVPMGPIAPDDLVFPDAVGAASTGIAPASLNAGSATLPDAADSLAQAYAWPDTQMDPLINGPADGHATTMAVSASPTSAAGVSLLGLQSSEMMHLLDVAHS